MGLVFAGLRWPAAARSYRRGMTTPTRHVVVNVLDYGAVADGTTDCSAAFQRAVDALGPSPDRPFLQGGTVLVPAATGFYHFDRSVIVDHDNVRIVGEGPTQSVLESRREIPPLIFGLLRGTRDAAFTPLSTAHWVELSDILDRNSVTDTRWGYRTGGPDHTATVTFPCSPFALGPRTGAVPGWPGLRQLTVDFVVENNAGAAWGQTRVPLFGLVDENDRPSPFAMWISDFQPTAPIRFSFATDDGRYREIGVPLPDPAAAVLRCSLQLDLTTGAVAAWVDHVPQPPDTALINDGWGGPDLSLVPNPYAAFNLGALTPLADNRSGSVDGHDFATPDLTFAALRLSSVTQYLDLGAGDATHPAPAQQTPTRPVTDLDWLSVGDGVFAVLPMNEPPTTDDQAVLGDVPVPDLQVPWMSDASRIGHGLFQVNPPGDHDGVVGGGVEKLTINCGREVDAGGQYNYGQCVAVGHVFDFSMTDCVLQYVAQGLGSLNIVNSYPTRIDECSFAFQTDTAIYLYDQVAYGRGLEFSAFAQVLPAVNATVAFRDVYCNSSNCDTVAQLINSNGQLDSWAFDFEDNGSPRVSYFDAGIGKEPVNRNLTLVVRDCQIANNGPDAVGIRLFSANANGGLPSLLRGAGWCTVERSFTTAASARLPAIVSVDGPMWQGTFTGLPPTGPDLVVTTASPGASARIGVGAVPPAVTVPRPPGPDPIPDLPGLIGYYQVDSLTALDGDPIRVLTDRSGAGNHGQLHGSPPVYETDAVNGRAGLRFTGGWFTLPAVTSDNTTGSLTVFLAQRGYPVLDTNPTRLGGLRQYGGVWQLSNLLSVPVIHTTTDWAVYAVRYRKDTKVLDFWANGRRCDSRKHDHAGALVVNDPMLGAAFDGSFAFPGTLAAAVLADGALEDGQVDVVHRFLLHQHGIPV